MKSRILLLPLFLFLPFGFLSAQQNPDSTQDGCAFYNRLKKMSQSEFEKVLARAQAGDAAAQYQVGSAYVIGGPVRRNQDEAERWLLKSFEQHYRPPEQGVCVIHTPMVSGRDVPDSVAYRMWFSQVGDAFENETKMPGQTKAVLDMTHLSDGDQATLKKIVLAWYQQEKATCFCLQCGSRRSQSSAGLQQLRNTSEIQACQCGLGPSHSQNRKRVIVARRGHEI